MSKTIVVMNADLVNSFFLSRNNMRNKGEVNQIAIPQGSALKYGNFNTKPPPSSKIGSGALNNKAYKFPGICFNPKNPYFMFACIGK